MALCREGINFDDAFVLVARMESVRVLLALAAQEGWKVHYMDVRSAFLNGDLKEEVYARQPSGFVVAGEEGKVYRLCKALYGLRQAPRLGTRSWMPYSRKWASSRARMKRRCTGGAAGVLSC